MPRYPGALLGLIRKIDGRYSADAQYYRLLVHVRLAEDSPLFGQVRGYFITYDVVAEDPDQGLEMVKEFEGEAVGTVEVDEAEALEPRPEDPMGVYWRTGRAFYEKEGE